MFIAHCKINPSSQKMCNSSYPQDNRVCTLLIRCTPNVLISIGPPLDKNNAYSCITVYDTRNNRSGWAIKPWNQTTVQPDDIPCNNLLKERRSNGTKCYVIWETLTYMIYYGM